MKIHKIIFSLLSLFKGDIFALRKIYNLKIGKNCRLSKNNYGEEPYLISMGDHVSAIKVDFITHDGSVWLWRKENPNLDFFNSIEIESNIFIGHKSILLPGTYIESNVIIGAGSVVKGRLLKNSVYAGVPARKISSTKEYYLKNINKFSNTKLMSRKEKREFIMKNLNNFKS